MGIVLLASPALVLTYHVAQGGGIAGTVLQAAQQPWQIDELPAFTDLPAADRAVAHLKVAQSLLPHWSYLYRLLGLTYAATQQWLKASESFELAQQYAPHNALIAFESGVVYERMVTAIVQSKSISLTEQRRQGEVGTSPSAACNSRAVDCSSMKNVAQPFANLPGVPQAGKPFMVAPPGSSIRVPVHIPEQNSMLHVLLGVDPTSVTSGEDATLDDRSVQFSVAVAEPQSNLEVVLRQALPRRTLLRGWTPAAVDLARWTGKDVVLIFATDAEPGVDHVLAGWGEVLLMSREAAALAQYVPEARMRDAWRAAGLDAGGMTNEGDAALQGSEPDAALRWYRRAALIEPRVQPAIVFRTALAAMLARAPEADQMIERVKETDPGFRVRPLGQPVTIQGRDFRWVFCGNPALPAGTPLNYGSGDAKEGYMWWSGEGVALVANDRERHVVVRARVRRSMPPPVEMAVGIDGNQSRHVSLTAGDNGWENIELSVVLSKGLHGIHVWFYNAGEVDGVKRDAVVDSVSIDEVTQ
ncbi:MAG: hypothetical protein NVSMB42_21240 [Herpetosiphon sp.]